MIMYLDFVYSAKKNKFNVFIYFVQYILHLSQAVGWDTFL